VTARPREKQRRLEAAPYPAFYPWFFVGCRERRLPVLETRVSAGKGTFEIDKSSTYLNLSNLARGPRHRLDRRHPVAIGQAYELPRSWCPQRTVGRRLVHSRPCSASIALVSNSFTEYGFFSIC
jgi:hypothetical protein